MAEKKAQKIKMQSDYLSGSASSEDEVNLHLCTFHKERVYGTIKGSMQVTQAALSHTTVQCNPMVERGPPKWPKIKKLSKEQATDISVHICDIISLSISSSKMNISRWRKAADLIAQGTQANQQVWAVTTAESNQLESLPLSALSAYDSGPLQMTYGTEQPLTASTPRATLTSIQETQTTDTYYQIIPGMSKCLYPTLVADGSLSIPIVDNFGTLQNQITSEIDK